MKIRQQQRSDGRNLAPKRLFAKNLTDPGGKHAALHLPLYTSCCSHPEAAITCRWKKFERTEKHNKVNKSFQNPGGRSCSALGRATRTTAKPGRWKCQKYKKGAQKWTGDSHTHRRTHTTQIRGGSRGDHSTSSWGPAASEEGPSAGGRLRRRTVEQQSSPDEDRSGGCQAVAGNLAIFVPINYL